MTPSYSLDSEPVRVPSSLSERIISSPASVFSSDLPMAIIRNRNTGQIRAILSDVADVAAAQAEAGRLLGYSADDLDVHFSRGIPDAAAWRR